MNPIQLLINRNTDLALKVPVLFRAARKYRGITQVEVANAIQIEQGTLSKIEAGQLSPSIELWYLFCKFTQIPFECVNYGFIDYGKQVILKTSPTEGGFKIPNKFSEFRADTVRSLLPLIRFYLHHLGTHRFNDFLFEQKLDPHFFIIHDNVLNINFRIELVQSLLREGLLGPENLPQIFSEPSAFNAAEEVTRDCTEVHGFSSTKSMTPKTALMAFIKNQNRDQIDFQYHLSKKTTKNVEISVVPESHLEFFTYRTDESLGKFQCHYQKAQLISFLKRSANLNVNIKELKCHYSSLKNESCNYKLDIAV